MKNLKMLSLFLAGILAALAVSGTAYGWGESNPKAIGMGGAYTALARNLDAPYWNPANLALSDGGRFSINIFSAGVGVNNNSFSLADYNKYNGSYLNDGDKQDILNSIPRSGLSLDALAEASALNFSVGNFALTAKGFGASKVNLDRDPLELLLYGNAVKREVSFANSYSEGYGLADLSLSYGYMLMAWQSGEFAVGASAHYLRGLAYQKIVEAQGGVATTDTGFVGNGTMRMRTALGGSGLSFDAGLALRFNQSWYFSAAWQNLYSMLQWNSDTEETLYMFDMQPITIEGAADSTQSDSLVTSSDSTYSVGAFKSDLAPTVRLGLAKRYRKLTWSLDWSQAIASRPGQGINPRLAGGIEYLPLNFLPLRAGAAFGGNKGSLYSFGFGLHFGPYNFDLGMANSGTPWPANTKGFELAVAMGLYF